MKLLLRLESSLTRVEEGMATSLDELIGELSLEGRV